MYILYVLPDDTFLTGHVPMTVSAEDSSMIDPCLGSDMKEHSPSCLR